MEARINERTAPMKTARRATAAAITRTVLREAFASSTRLCVEI